METAMRTSRLILAALFALVGLVWIGQGIGAIGGSVMSGQPVLGRRRGGADRRRRGDRGARAPAAPRGLTPLGSAPGGLTPAGWHTARRGWPAAG